MKKQATKGIMVILAIILFIPFTGFAQDKKGPNTVTIVTLTLNMSAEGTAAEADSLFSLLDKNVTKKNKFVNSITRVRHLYGSSSQDFLVITEYNGSDLGIIDQADTEGFELFKKWKPDVKDRTDFNTAMNKFFTSKHSDEIYSLISKVSK